MAKKFGFIGCADRICGKHRRLSWLRFNPCLRICGASIATAILQHCPIGFQSPAFAGFRSMLKAIIPLLSENRDAIDGEAAST